MELWSDYEGKTIADAYPIGHLIRPEGRSAFFETTNGTGTPAVIRLTESLNDETEMLERWRQVSELHQEHLVVIRKFGQTRFESTPLTYALMEPADGSLADILQERTLTPVEAREVAVSLVDALMALHAAGMVHERVEPANVMAVGEVVKLRSDCVRECRLDDEFFTQADLDEVKRRDVQGLATTLLQALTQERTPRASMKLPAPFDRIVAHGLDGSWGLKEIDAALNPPVVKPLVPESVLRPGTATAAVSSPAAPYAAAAAVPVAVQTAASAEDHGPVLNVRRERVTVDDSKRTVVVGGRPMQFWMWCAGGVLALILIGWMTLSGKSSAKSAASAPAATTAPGAFTPLDEVPEKPGTSVAAPAAATHTAPAHAVAAAHAPVATAETQAGWHVIAFTYNHEEQAFGKVASLRARHSGLSPEVFSPNGHAPYYVALGGAMSEREAAELRQKGWHEGMPRDMFIRRYGR